MNRIIYYKNYSAEINFSKEDNVYYGKLLGIKDLVSFEANSEDDLEKAFAEAVEDYFEINKI